MNELSKSPFRRQLGWERRSIAIAASGYSAAGLLAVWMLPGHLVTIAHNSLAALFCWGAFFWSARQPRRATLFAIGVVGAELTWVIFHDGRVDSTIPLLIPVLLLTVGLLSGGRSIVVATVVAGVAVLVAPMAGRAVFGLPKLSAGEAFDLIVLEIEIVGTAYFGWLVLSARNRLLAETHESRKRYKLLFDHAPDGLVELDRHARIVRANPVASEILNLASGTSAGRLLSEVLQANGARTAFDPARMQTGQLLSIELGESPDARYLEIAAEPQPGAESRMLLVIRDTTARRLLDAQREQAARLETVGRLAGGIAHDLNNMLTAIGGNAEMLRLSHPREIDELARGILTAERRAASLIRRLLSFAQHDFRQPRTFDLHRAVATWGKLLQQQAGERHRVEVAGHGPAVVTADEMHLQRILLNLVGNARDASADGQPISVLVGLVRGEEAGRLGSSLPAERQVVVEVTDRGSGMTAEVKSRLFEPFFTTKPQGQGTGLGLAEVHGLVAQNKGSIEIESALNLGTTVRLFFPLTGAERGPGAPGPP